MRDLAAWIVTATEDGLSGTFNATGAPTTLGALLAACQKVIAASTSELVWVTDRRLLDAGVQPWMGVGI